MAQQNTTGTLNSSGGGGGGGAGGFPEGDWWGARDSARESLVEGAEEQDASNLRVDGGGMSDDDVLSAFGNSMVSNSARQAAAAAAEEADDEQICPLRLRTKGHEPNLVLKDNDLNFKLRLQRRSAAAVSQQLQKDSDFLRSMEIMDYSLLLGEPGGGGHRGDTVGLLCLASITVLLEEGGAAVWHLPRTAKMLHTRPAPSRRQTLPCPTPGPPLIHTRPSPAPHQALP